ncbi:tRNA (adenosine(37)-N6)-threonylcarbamoyltransferase complex transferase subunit TsaD [Candidatus Acetothermia bacterium]|jgi:N6-L-threonylcarbamoyladenine synthase|nr:tRNA (adenosine(37)-N6)-threonylcarbamoyltransferase complex transferase subunit TsaD [Candidatus Acetothermia bacterium]MCI2426814.1 tRNA (adenosine(37)-N6)-threonylcarbamoyltransferase complex transferase subunit TsaD [Candidatus Acetothermia bacterium]MCI2427859.1 tRNA (adenosine(37)-N6)-threonylcarbamoyltransferase complex transferase subunit TsaD [Candidatus Acetothermia bacterium]MCI2428801.1 tRNA (adenosine(37)-N6)-threonylcarbamoyltransferase complex transferase subunit TsaD [Candidat
MERSIYTLGIETSCDETAIAILRNETDILANIVYSQAGLHAKYGGVVPEIASRNHLRKLPYLVKEGLEHAKIKFSDLSLVAATYGPGLVGPLLVGLSAAKGIACGSGAAFLGVNHLEGHIFSHRLAYPTVKPPFLVLIVSGGHTSLVEVKRYGEYQPIGATRDDAAGEVLDKVGKMLGLDYPAGKEIDKLAIAGDQSTIRFPRPMLGDTGFDFSFSGLKTATAYYLRENPTFKVEDVAASFLAAVIDVLVDKTLKAARRYKLTQIAVVGGVAANSLLRRRLTAHGKRFGIQPFFPPLDLCTDNGAMIAATAVFRYIHLNEQHDPSLEPAPSLEF